MKTCSGDWRHCQYACQGSSAYIYCKYEEFCVYQLPREVSKLPEPDAIIDGVRIYGKPKNPQDPISNEIIDEANKINLKEV